MNNPLVSIVICTHNRAEMLKQTLDTVFDQQYRPVEVLIVNDGSTDNTQELIKSYGDKVRYHYKVKSCIAATRTTACKMARGEYIAFQDDDDLMVPDRIISLLKALQRYPEATLAVGDWEYIDAQGNPTGERTRFHVGAADEDIVLLEDGYKAVLWPLVTPLPHTTLFRKADGEHIGWFDETRFFHGCSDTDFFARLGLLGPIVYIPKIVSYYRIGHSQIWGNEFLGEFSRFLLFEKHLNAIACSRKDLRKRLQYRMLNTLKRIVYLQKKGYNTPLSFKENYLEKGLSMLDLTSRLKYYWYASITLHIRRFIGSLSIAKKMRSDFISN